jgi:hypothetical protein
MSTKNKTEKNNTKISIIIVKKYLLYRKTLYFSIKKIATKPAIIDAK